MLVKSEPMNLFDLSGELAVVIGGTGSLGGAMAQGLGEAGAHVLILGRSQERGEARAEEIRARGGTADLSLRTLLTDRIWKRPRLE